MTKLNTSKTLIEGGIKTLIRESTIEQIEAYWGVRVRNHPEDIIRMLTDLHTGRITFENFNTDISFDIYDSFRDENFENDSSFFYHEDEDFERNSTYVS